MFSDKNISDFLKEFSDISSKIILSKIESPRSATPEEIEEYFKDKNKIIKVNNLKEAIKVARKISSEKDLILITGSLYLVGEALKLYKSFEIF
jgi:dihydrofolate synthase/folylpolyglutamate synthase